MPDDNLDLNVADFEKREYYEEIGCSEDNSYYFNLARTIAESFTGRLLDVGCGLGWLVKHLRKRGVDAWGIDDSKYAIEHSVASEYCICGDARRLQDFFPATFDIIVMKDVAQALELHDLIEVFRKIHIGCRGRFFFIDHILQPQVRFAIFRSTEWYVSLLKHCGWGISEIQPFLRKVSELKDLLVLESCKTPSFTATVPEFIDPWLVHHDNTNIMTCTLTTSPEETAAFVEAHKDLWITPHFAPKEGTRYEREKIGVTRGSGDYAFISNDTARISRDWLYSVLAQFRDPNVGVVFSPVQWLGHSEQSFSEEDFWRRCPMMFRTLAYQQSQGLKSKFDELGWKVGRINTPLQARKSEEDREFNEVPSITIITPFDDSKEKLVSKYFEVLNKIGYPREKLHVSFWDDSRGKSSISDSLATYVRNHYSDFASIKLSKSCTDDYWLNMQDDTYYRWEGVKYPISARVASLYNRATKGITTDRVLFWESDTIPIYDNFLDLLSDNLDPFDGAISAHYVCRKEKKSLAWDIVSLAPFSWEWAETGSGIQVVDIVPHGMLLMNSWCLQKFRFNVLSCDPRDLRGPDLIMGRDFKQLGIKLKINWDNWCDHYESDGTTFYRPGTK